MLPNENASWVSWDTCFMGHLGHGIRWWYSFLIWPEEGQCHDKQVQIRSNVQIQNFLTKTYLSCPIMCQDSKYIIYFRLWHLKMSNTPFRRCEVIAFTCFFHHCTTKNKDISFKFGMLVVGTELALRRIFHF